ncbi:DNA-binding response OmpR family regulator [Bradyrhizobium sp. GM2.2]
MQGTGVTILVVEDEQLIRDMVADALSDGGFEAEVAVSGEVQLVFCRATKPSIAHSLPI